MSITDAQRHKLHTKLDHVLGEEDAAVLISHLPPSGWSDVVRTRDLDQLEASSRRQVRRGRPPVRGHGVEVRSFTRAGAGEQTNRFFLGMGAMLSLLAAVQALLA